MRVRLKRCGTNSPRVVKAHFLQNFPYPPGLTVLNRDRVGGRVGFPPPRFVVNNVRSVTGIDATLGTRPFYIKFTFLHKALDESLENFLSYTD